MPTLRPPLHTLQICLSVTKWQSNNLYIYIYIYMRTTGGSRDARQGAGARNAAGEEPCMLSVTHVLAYCLLVCAGQRGWCLNFQFKSQRIMRSCLCTRWLGWLMQEEENKRREEEKKRREQEKRTRMRQVCKCWTFERLNEAVNFSMSYVIIKVAQLSMASTCNLCSKVLLYVSK